jgi:hypothetical protein
MDAYLELDLDLGSRGSPVQTSRRRSAHAPSVEEAASIGVAVAGIWAAVLAISVLAPDMVTGSEQQHMPVAALGTWMWGLGGTWAALGALGALRRSRRRHLHQPLALGVAALWFAAAVVAINAPVFETGSDPTRLPLAVFVAPVVATVLTTVVRSAVGVLDDLWP